MSMQQDPKGPWAVAPARGRRAFLGTAAGTALSLGWPLAGAAALPALRLDHSVTLSRARLDELARTAYANFNQGRVLGPYDGARHGAASDVRLHRIVTYTQVPHSGESVKVSGLLAVPANASGPIPVVSWQHGTILSFVQVPSNLTLAATPGYVLRENIDSAETLLNLHRFAAHGYAVIAADYLGKGPFRGNRPEAYAVKEASVATCVDILNAGLQALERLNLQASELFLNGWSQGGLNTQWLRQELQRRGVPVVAAAASSPFNDLTQAFGFWSGGVSFPPPTAAPYPERPVWLTLATVILLGSYQSYYGLDGLLQAAVRPEYRAAVLKFWNDYAFDFDAQAMPLPEKLLIDGFFDRYSSEAGSEFLRRLAANRASFWNYGSPMRLYYGLADEAIHPAMARRPLGAGGRHIDGVAVPRASHRATFLASLYGEAQELEGKPNLLAWFDSLRAG